MSKRAMLLIDILVIVLCTIGMALAQDPPEPDPWAPWSPPRKITPTPTPTPSPPPGVFVHISWDQPSPFPSPRPTPDPEDIASYNILRGTTSGEYTESTSTLSAVYEWLLQIVPGVHYFALTAINTGGSESIPSEEVAYNTFTMDALNAWLPRKGVWFAKQGPMLKAKAVKGKPPKKKARQRRGPAQSGGREPKLVDPLARRTPAKPVPRDDPRRPRGSKDSGQRARELQRSAVPQGGE